MSGKKQIKVWDPLVRIFHWTLVSAFAIAFVTEDEFLDLHVYAGYTVLGLLTFRLVWGFIGSRHARFSDFVRRPSAALTYLKEMSALRAKRHLGHNPAGGLMIVALLLSLLITSLSGLAAYGVEGFGPLSGWFQHYGIWNDEWLEELHEFFANFTLLLVVGHLAGVLLGSLLHQENLVRAMFTGRKRTGA
jgi:cytochrome b